MSKDQSNTDERPWLNTMTGTRVRIKTPGRDTNNRLTVIEYIEPPHSTPPVFTRHEFVEVFYLLEGTLTFQFADEQRLVIQQGEQVTCPSWKPHSFWNETDCPATALLICTPSGLDEFFEASDRLLKSSADATVRQPELLASEMQRLRNHYGLEHVGTPPSIDE